MSSIGVNLRQVKLNTTNFTSNKEIKENKQPCGFTTSSIKPDLNSLKANFVPFLGITQTQQIDTKEVSSVLAFLEDNADDLWKKTEETAKASGSGVISSLHFFKAAAQDALKELNSQKPDFNNGFLNYIYEINLGKMSTEQLKTQLQTSLQGFIKKLDQEINKLPKSSNGPIEITQEFKQILNDAQTYDCRSWNGFGTQDIKLNTIFNCAMYDLETIDNPEREKPGLRQNTELFEFSAKLTGASDNFIKQALQYAPKKEMNIKSWSEIAKKQAQAPQTINLNQTATGSVTASEVAPAEPKKDIVLTKTGGFNNSNLDLNQASDNGILYDFDHYKHKADVVATLISAGRNGNFVYNRGARPEFIAHKFTNMLKAGEFKNLNTTNTECYMWDMNKIMTGDNPDETINKIKEFSVASKEDGKHRVIFVKDFPQLLNIKELNANTLFSSERLGDKVHIIGLTDNEILKELTEPVNGKQKVRELQWQNYFEEISATAPSPKQCKELLKADPRVIHNLTCDYKPGGIMVEQDAIDKAVDVAITSRQGDLPGKALDLLDLIVATKCTKEENVDKITANDVMTYLKSFPDFKQAPTSAGGTFSIEADTGVRMKDVGGAKQAKAVVEEVLDFIHNPDKYTQAGAKMPKGILLSGTPGNGKTYMAKAIAGEAGVPFIAVSGSDFVEKYVGVGAGRVRELFKFAREQAQALAEPGKKGTAIIFIDEFDAVGKKRGAGSGGGDREAEQTLNQLLVEMDGMSGSDNVNIMVLAATNRPELLDDALVERPGRFDHKIDVPDPSRDTEARYEILEIHAKNKQFDGDRKEILTELADRTSGCSGARLADIINKASFNAAKEGRYKLKIDDLIEAKLESISGRVTSITNPEWAQKMTIAHECGHALTSQVIQNITKDVWKLGSEIDIITNQPRGKSLGAVYYKPSENTEATFESQFASMISGYGGHAVEKAFYGMTGSWGISQDLKQSKEAAVRCVTKMGLGPKTGLNIPLDDKQLTPENQDDIKLFIKQASRISHRIVEFHKSFVSEYLVKHADGSNLSNKDFQKELNAWYDAQPGRKEEFAKLTQEIHDITEATKKGKTNIQRTTKK